VNWFNLYVFGNIFFLDLGVTYFPAKRIINLEGFTLINDIKNKRVDNMTAAAVDLDLLNELFDNQKKLDDLFSLDDDSFLKSMSFGTNALKSSELNGEANIVNIPPEDLSFNSDDLIFNQKKRSTASFIIPLIVEIAIIVGAIIYFT
jgi:hypothetical protein